MGCFLACFGSSKDRKRRRQRHKVQPRDQRNANCTPPQSAASLVHDRLENTITPLSEVPVKPVEQLSLSTDKRVTFDSNIRTYEHEEVTDFSLKIEEGGKKKEENSEKSSQSHSSDVSSITSSAGSYPSNHRYQNCRDSEDELDDDSDVDDDHDDDVDGVLEDYDDIYEDDYDASISRARTPVTKVVTNEIDSSTVRENFADGAVKPIGLNCNTRDRSTYVHSVLNPVENLTQWKAVKARGTPPLGQQKENSTLDQESQKSFSSEPCFKEMSFSFKEKSDQPKKSNQEIAVDASLSTWLGSAESTPSTKTSTRTIALDSITPKQSMLQGSNSPISFEDRPILGALTVEELKQLSNSSSPRKSPSKSPEEMPIIGTVGTYWNDTNFAKDSGSATSYKGIPNTTSKYREDKRVKWHSTPFETRLERALNRGVPAAYSSQSFD
ncbi:hypothetical protein HS088_TW12G00163 [Tripterygium wilfordii]|uniref:Eisosome protein SEG2 n=1 Tax=Tripterygium wilfordii TaxID=458696 RepID=A0A7J7CXX5_TRIWF|nr:eisosome protein SEG2-like [Tripterygium wilfordii]KAF5738967.1 hypothetical protein HS088_TW12G00163 [Tripterygium wilfordii]